MTIQLDNQLPAQEVRAIDATPAAKSLANTLSSMIAEWTNSLCFLLESNPDEQADERANIELIKSAVFDKHPEIMDYFNLLERNSK